MKTDRKKRTAGIRRSRATIKFDNLYYLNAHYDLAMTNAMIRHINLVKLNSQLSKALQTIVKEQQ
jgi:hypothetical protein